MKRAPYGRPFAFRGRAVCPPMHIPRTDLVFFMLARARECLPACWSEFHGPLVSLPGIALKTRSSLRMFFLPAVPGDYGTANPQRLRRGGIR